MGPRFNPQDQRFFNKLIDDGDRFNSDQILLRNMLRIWSELSLLRFGVSDQNLLRKFGPISAIEIQSTNWKGEISSESM